MHSNRKSTAQLLLYSAPGMAPALINLPTAMILPTIYVENTGVTLAAIGAVNLLRWWFDAVTDPVIGYLSDRTDSRWGHRKPWVVAGAFISAICAFFLFRPSADVGVVYYALLLLGVYLGFTFFTIGHQAWGSELAVDYKDRSRISTYYSVFTVIGSLLIWTMPFLLLPMTGSLEMGPMAMIGIGWMILILLPGTSLLAAKFVPDGNAIAVEKTDMKEVWHSLKGNKLLWRYVTAVAVWGIGQGVFLSVIFVFMRDYLQLGDKFPLMMIAFFVVQTFAMPVWMKLMNRFSKHRVWAFSWAVYALIQPFVLLLEPGSSAFIPALILTSISAFINAASYIAPMALLGDIADYGILKTGSNNTGNYFAFRSILEKANFGIGTGIAFPLLAYFGYQIGGVNTASANMGLIFTYLAIPAATSIAAACILWNFPLDERRHAIIRKRIESRAERALRDARLAAAGKAALVIE